MRVEWDENKNARNKKIHGISFEEAAMLFGSQADYLELFDEAHSDFEERLIAIGPISRGIVLVVWTERDEDVIRIISARMATKVEQRLYAKYVELQNG